MVLLLAETKKDGESFFNFVSTGFKYNLQVLPDVLMSATLLFSVLFQSPPMAVFGTAMILLQFLHSGMTSFTRAYIPNMTYSPADYQKCGGRFPGASFSNVFQSALGSGTGAADGWPSYYCTFMGFVAGWIGTLPSLYGAELASVPEKQAAVAAGLIILSCLLVIVLINRITTDCEGFMSVALGLLAGFVIGVGGVMLASAVTDRRATNMLGLPLIRNKAATGQPIYVCERPGAGATAAA